MIFPCDLAVGRHDFTADNCLLYWQVNQTSLLIS